MTALLLTVTGFFSGALPFSVLISRHFLKTNIRNVGDGNPGTFNVLKAGGFLWGALAFVLDIFKGLIPVAVANFWFGLTGLSLVAVALSPLLGHAFSPFLGFKGGKAVATTFGVWCGLTIWEGPTVFGLMLGFWFAFINESGWVVMFTSLSLLAYLLLAHPAPVLLAVWLGNFLIFVWKHRAELTAVPTLQAWYRNMRWRS